MILHVVSKFKNLLEDSFIFWVFDFNTIFVVLLIDKATYEFGLLAKWMFNIDFHGFIGVFTWDEFDGL